MRWYFGIRLLAYPRVETCRAIFVTGDYEPSDLWHLWQLIMPGMVIVDVGAHLGLYSLFSARLVGPNGLVVSVEPSLREFARLQTHMALNGEENVRLLRVAVSDRDGEGELLVCEDEHSGHNTLGLPRYPDVAPDHKEKVSVRKLDSIVKELHLPHIDVVKIDVEGHEHAVLVGSMETLSRFRPLILIEVMAGTGNAFQVLREVGYELFECDDTTALLTPAEMPEVLGGNVLAVPRDGPWLSRMEMNAQFHKPAGGRTLDG